jgi:AcrR family transcriptional regulator
MGRPREHGDQIRAALLETAARILAVDGPYAVSVRRVADEAGTTTRAVYSLFGDRDGLLLVLWRDVAADMRRLHDEVPRRANPEDELLDLALAYRAGALARPNAYELYLGLGGVKLPLTEQDRALAYASFTRVLDTLQRCVDQGRFPGRDPVAIGLQGWGLVHGLASLELRSCLGPPADAEARWRDAVEAIIAGYRQAPTTPNR